MISIISPARFTAVGLAVHELAVNFASRRVDHGYLEVLIVAKAVVAEVLRKHPAVRDRFNVAAEFYSDPVPHRNAVFHIEEECLHCPRLGTGSSRESGLSGAFSTYL
jgi:hypothetical protein